MPMQFAMANDLAKVNGVKSMVYAESGVGKTVLCATMPRPLLISAESGTLSISKANLVRLFGADDPEIEYNMPTIIISSYADLEEAYRWCLQSAEAKNFDSICLDSSSEIAEKVLSAALEKVKDPRQAYGELSKNMLDAMKLFRDLPGKHVLITSKMEKDKDEVSGAMLYQPMMPGKKVGPALPYLFDEVFRLGIGKTQDGKSSFRFLQTQPDMQYIAKDRSGALDAWEHPRMTRVINKIMQGV